MNAARFAPRDRTEPSPAVSAEGLRVALFSGNYNCVRDGANRALNRLAAHLIERGAAVRVYSPTVAEPAFEPAGDLVSVPSIGIPRRPEYRLSIRFPKSVRDDVAAFRPTHVHLSCPDYAGGRALAFARQRGIPAVASMHTRFETYLDYYGLGLLNRGIEARLRRFYTGCDGVMAPNAAMAESLVGFGVPRERIHLWARGVDRSIFSPQQRSQEWRRRHGYRAGEPVVLFFGRLVHEKGLDVFAACVAELRARGLPVRPLVVGDGPARGWLRQRLGEAVFTGHLDGEALGRAVASADILVNPSVTEAFGNVNLEAMAAGLAVVSADVGSASALISNEREGLLVDPKSPVAYADAVETLIRHPARRARLGAAAAAASLAYNWPDILDAVIGVYRLTAAA